MKTQATPTPAPWIALEEYKGLWIVRNKDGENVAMQATDCGDYLTEGDAKLISAAPELLAAAEACRNIIAQNRGLTMCQGSEWVYLLEKLDVAIQKARGQ